MKNPPTNSPSLQTSRSWDSLGSDRPQINQWFLDPFLSLSPPFQDIHVPCPRGLHSLDSGWRDAAQCAQGDTSWQARWDFRELAFYYQCLDKSVQWSDCTFVDILSWTTATPAASGEKMLGELGLQTHVGLLCSTVIPQTSTNTRRFARLLAWYWYGRNGHHNLMVINMGPLKQGVGWVRRKPGPLASLKRTKSTSKGQTGPNDCGGFLGFKGSKEVSGKMAERKEEAKPSGGNYHAAGRHQGGCSEFVI